MYVLYCVVRPEDAGCTVKCAVGELIRASFAQNSFGPLDLHNVDRVVKVRVNECDD